MKETDLVQPDRRSLLLGGAALAAFGVGSLVSAAPASAASSPYIRMYENIELARRQAGARRLYRSYSMSRVAQVWAKELAQSGRLRHNPNYARQIPKGWRSASENVGYTGAGHSRPEDVLHRMWLQSSGHRANILGDHSHVGIGRFVDSRGRLWGVQIFAQYI